MSTKRLMIVSVIISLLLVVTVYSQDLGKNAVSGGTPDLLKAILNGQTQTALALINNGVDVNATDTTAGSAPGSTALMYAAWKGDTAVVNALLQKGADVNAENKFGHTALLKATVKGHANVVKALLQKGAIVDVKENILGRTSLQWAAWHVDTTIMLILLANGANVNAQDSYGNTALMDAITNDAVINGHIVAVQILLSKGANVRIKNKSGSTALKMATNTYKNPDIAKLLKQVGAKE